MLEILTYHLSNQMLKFQPSYCIDTSCQLLKIGQQLGYHRFDYISNMMHYYIHLRPRTRGFHIITDEILNALPGLPDSGLFHAFIQHTSAGLCINENADPTVLNDFENYFNSIVPENQPGLLHTVEGPDDMPAHIKASLIGSSITIPIVKGQLALGTWQGIYLGEFRNRPRSRSLLISISA